MRFWGEAYQITSHRQAAFIAFASSTLPLRCGQRDKGGEAES